MSELRRAIQGLVGFEHDSELTSPGLLPLHRISPRRPKPAEATCEGHVNVENVCDYNEHTLWDPIAQSFNSEFTIH